FNTPRAMVEVFDLVRLANQEDVPGAGAAVLEMLSLVGLESLGTELNAAPSAEATGLLEQREAARAERDFARADQIRDELAALGWDVRDGSTGATLVPRSGS
ncbi:MAG: cysteine--tRNA ligase, partial [Solirubrobacterales bacterium]